MNKKTIVTLFLMLNLHLTIATHHEASEYISSQITNGCKMIWKVPVAGVCGLGHGVVSGCNNVYNNVPISSLCNVKNGFSGAALGVATGGLCAGIKYLEHKDAIDSCPVLQVLAAGSTIGFVVECTNSGAFVGTVAPGLMHVGSEFSSGAYAGFKDGLDNGGTFVDSINLQEKLNCSPQAEAATWAFGTSAAAGLAAYAVVELCKNLPDLKC